MTPDTIPSRAPITLTLQQDEAWLLGALLVAGCWLCLLVVIDLLAPLVRRMGGVRTWR